MVFRQYKDTQNTRNIYGRNRSGLLSFASTKRPDFTLFIPIALYRCNLPWFSALWPNTWSMYKQNITILACLNFQRNDNLQFDCHDLYWGGQIVKVRRAIIHIKIIYKHSVGIYQITMFVKGPSRCIWDHSNILGPNNLFFCAH